MEGGPPSFRQGFSCPAVLRNRSHRSRWCFVYRTLTSCRGAFQLTSTTLLASAGHAPLRPYNPEVQAPRFGLLPVRSPLLGESRLISLPGATEMFQFTPLASLTLCIQVEMTASSAAGFPHSGIAGSKDACSSPTLFAAYHALPRLSVPRHSPCALVRLTGNSSVLQTHTHTILQVLARLSSFASFFWNTPEDATLPPHAHPTPPDEHPRSPENRYTHDKSASPSRAFPRLDPCCQ